MISVPKLSRWRDTVTPKACVSQRKAAQTHAQGICLSGHLVRITFALFSCRSEESWIGRMKQILYMIPEYPCNPCYQASWKLIARVSKRRLTAPRQKKAWQWLPLSPHCWLWASSERLPEQHPSSPALPPRGSSWLTACTDTNFCLHIQAWDYGCWSQSMCEVLPFCQQCIWVPLRRPSSLCSSCSSYTSITSSLLENSPWKQPAQPKSLLKLRARLRGCFSVLEVVLSLCSSPMEGCWLQNTRCCGSHLLFPLEAERERVSLPVSGTLCWQTTTDLSQPCSAQERTGASGWKGHTLLM